MKENRQHPRLSIGVDVDVTTGSNFYAGRTRDLSLGGLFVETEVGLPIGMPIEVKLKLPKGNFNLACEVVWMLSDRAQRVVGVGVRFLDLSPAAKRAIEAFMSVRTPVPFESPEPDDAPVRPPPLPGAIAASPDAKRSHPTPKEGPRPKVPAPRVPPRAK